MHLIQPILQLSFVLFLGQLQNKKACIPLGKDTHFKVNLPTELETETKSVTTLLDIIIQADIVSVNPWLNLSNLLCCGEGRLVTKECL